MADILIGNSGFSYQEKVDHVYRKRGSHTYTDAVVKNVKTGKIAFTVRGSLTYNPYAKYSTGTKTFLGLDERYYYIQVVPEYGRGAISWGQVQSDGAVLKDDRTILKHLNFFPLYLKAAPVVVPVIRPATKPQITTLPPKPEIKPEVKELSWIQKIVNWIIRILNR